MTHDRDSKNDQEPDGFEIRSGPISQMLTSRMVSVLCSLARVAAVVAAMVAVSGSLAAQAISWTDALEKVEASAEKYRDYARRHDTTWAGAMYNDWHITRHTCAVLGRMLGRPDVVLHLEAMAYPPLLEPPPTEYYPHEMLVFAISLENWVFVVRRLLSESDVGRINQWNLTCAGYDGIPASAAISSPQPEADFVRDGNWLRVLGDIDPGFADRFRAALDANPGVDEIVLGSDGGSVRDALASGGMIRERGLKTTLGGNCNSACPLVFLGGINRVVWAGTARFGLHQISRGGVAVPPNDPVYHAVSAYISEMGGNPEGILWWMLSAAPEDMARPNPDEYCALGLATWVQRVCGF